MLYAMKSDVDRGPIGAWARNARLSAGYPTAKSAIEAAHAAGIPVTLGHVQGIEAGWDRAGRDLLTRLGEFYGSDPPIAHPPPLVSPEALDEIRSAVAEGVALGVARALAQLAGPQPPPRRPRRQ
jgi:hypothetical protein